jgi:uncharacterized protein YpmB
MDKKNQILLTILLVVFIFIIGAVAGYYWRGIYNLILMNV